MSDPARVIPDDWHRAGTELVALIEEQAGDAAAEVREKTALLSTLAAELLIARSRGEDAKATTIQNRMFMTLAMLGELERSRLQELFEGAVWIAARILRAALGVPA